MEQAGLRALVHQTADDLAWLEQHARRQPDEAAQAGALRLAAALVRNVVGPCLDGQPSAPLHVAVVGGAGAGKSTVANFLIGAVLAESNPQAGFTRHPIAYTGGNGQLQWPAHAGFLGTLQKLMQPESASLDQDVYQVRRLEGHQSAILEQFVVWDCPDMTTWAASNYAPRLLEVAGLSDVIIYVASDERYNDAVPTQYLKLLLDAGKAVVVCLVKMKEADVPAFVKHFEHAVLAPLHAKPVACLAIPHLSREQLADPVQHAGQWRIPLLNQVGVLGAPPEVARRRSVRSALAFLKFRQDMLLGVAKQDLVALQTWQHIVREGQREFDNRYRREFLSAERLQRFDESLLRLMQLLELPGVGRYVSGAMNVLNTPVRWFKKWFVDTLGRPQPPAMPERPVLEAALSGWIDLLRKEAARRASSHPLWQHIQHGFGSGLTDSIELRFDQSLAAFHASMSGEVEQTARGIYEDLEKSPVALNTFRGAKLTLEVGVIAGTIATAGLLNWINLVLIPLATTATNQLIELLGQKYVENQKEQAKSRQQMMVTQHLSGPLADWLIQWPATGGSTYERLQQILHRLPANIGQLEAAVEERLKQPATV
jgi:hypothetical protein